ncbi:MAG: lipoyl synthase [Thermoplasmata archaeon]|nr:lipoyl synthase [Thermoplasmata archaeon]
MSAAPPSVSAAPAPSPRLPEWIRSRPPSGEYPRVRSILHGQGLGTVCREARCPNLSECWSAGTATLMLLGTQCSRRCTFCAVETRWGRGAVDESEPSRVAEAVRSWGLRYVVLTQVCRDDLEDGGAAILAETVRSIRAASPGTLVELLIGDLAGSTESLGVLMKEAPDVLAHNLETTRRLSREVRDRRAGYDQSLSVLREARRLGPADLVTKSSIMLGLGEGVDELTQCFADLRAAGVDLLTLGQYLRPSPSHRPVDRYVPPEEFLTFADAARSFGFAGVESGPMVRSSYHARELFESAHAIRRS